MFEKASKKQSLFDNLGSAAFKNHIAPKIAEHIQVPIDVRVTGEDAYLNAWLIENLSTISTLHVTTHLQRPDRLYQKRASYE